MSELTARERSDYLLQCVAYLEGRIQFVDEKAERLLALLTVVVALTGLVPAVRDLPTSPWRAVLWSVSLLVLAVLVAAVLRNVLLCIRPTSTFFIASTTGRSGERVWWRALGRQVHGWFREPGGRRPEVERVSLLWPTPRRAWEDAPEELRRRHGRHLRDFDDEDVLEDLVATHLRLFELVSRKYRYYDAANTAVRSLLVLWLPLLLLVVVAT